MRVLVCGSRTFDDYRAMHLVLKDISYPSDTVFISGHARGADSLAEQWANNHGFPLEIYPADWEMHGRAAGPIRNQEMLDTGVDLVVAFPRGKARGTKHMIKIAKEAGVKVIEA